jgi:hypothetical protein
MPDLSKQQLSVASEDSSVNELLLAHRAILAAWYSNWRAEQQDRLEKLLLSRSSAQDDPTLVI